MPVAYIIVDTKISDPETYEVYKSKVVPIAASYGGEYLARGGAMEIVQDELWSPTRLVLLRYPSMDQARAFLNSEEYAPVKDMRLGASEATLVIFEGV
ncbi:MAG: DUF1330 domain-containing protein [Alphaproteobacteria bacterium]